MSAKRTGACLACIAAAGITMSMPATAADCQSLSGKRFGGALVVETNNIKPPFVTASMAPQGVTVTSPFCRVRGLIRPTADSTIYFEVWMPPADAWNGNYQGNAPGGYAGSMFYEPMERALRAGYATSTTDNGHTGSEPSEWAAGHPEKFADWGWRAVHETALAAKAVIAAYYGGGPKYSYFIGCSKGGGSAIMEAQRFPTDYDGLIAGAMGWNLSARLAMYLWTIQAVQPPGACVSPAKLAMLHDSVIAACGGNDGILDDPGACTFDPGRLLCKGADADACLSPQQVASVRKIYAGPVDASGASIYPGYARGSELNWSRAIMGAAEKPGVGTISYKGFTNRARDLLFDNQEWKLETLVPAEVYRLARTKLGMDWDAPDTDLHAFKAAGGKIIGYQGWSDDAVPPDGTLRYYDQVAERMGGVDKVRSFYRLFMAPGMDHCSGGIGASAIGGAYGQTAPVRDAGHDVAAALARWVEQGQAPEQIVATRYRDHDPAKGIALQRPLCAHPAVARHTGRGNRNEAENWVCAAPTRSK
ncbi:tannase/feruloyl esterase family alpha/beta hydrolase [Massilia sp. LXY-6]|uniref:tannase/feruloyl esterase family alpha/beta hydrolase n=1 Tax=Massilia sp. LXY-6 TaxID=3379823 RepID=UPI003EE353AE